MSDFLQVTGAALLIFGSAAQFGFSGLLISTGAVLLIAGSKN